MYLFSFCFEDSVIFKTGPCVQYSSLAVGCISCLNLFASYSTETLGIRPKVCAYFMPPCVIANNILLIYSDFSKVSWPEGHEIFGQELSLLAKYNLKTSHIW